MSKKTARMNYNRALQSGEETMRHLKHITAPRAALTPDETWQAFVLDALIAILGLVARIKGV
jgi:hypothetical protein